MRVGCGGVPMEPERCRPLVFSDPDEAGVPGVPCDSAFLSCREGFFAAMMC